MRINSSSITLPWRTIQKCIIMLLKNEIKSVLGLDSGYTVRFSPPALSRPNTDTRNLLNKYRENLNVFLAHIHNLSIWLGIEFG